jgi:thymidylate synthase
MQTSSMNEAYLALFQELGLKGIEEKNERTGTNIIMLEGGYSFKLDLRNGRLPVPGNRQYFPHIAAAEVAWQFMGTKDPKFILRQAPKIWQDFVEDGELKTAYGYRWRMHFGRDQLAMACQQLRDNPTNRQLYISAWDPAIDGLGAPNQPKNIPCPVGFSLTRSKDQVHMSLFIRSSDVFVGLPYDIMGYALTLDAIAASCGCIPGIMHVTLAHAHFYEPHAQMIKECMIGSHMEWLHGAEPPLPIFTIQEIVNNPDNYVNCIKGLTDNLPIHPWSPKPGVVI